MSSVPPRNGEGDRAKPGGGGPRVLQAPIRTVKLARKLRKEMSPPERLLWWALKQRPGGYKFRKQCPQGPTRSTSHVCRLGRRSRSMAKRTIEAIALSETGRGTDIYKVRGS
jgi:hypothetical protein